MNEGVPPAVVDVSDLGPEQRYWARKVHELKGTSLPTLRSTAEKWAASITGVLGVVGLAALFEGQDKFDGLDDPEQTLGKAAFFLAVLCALWAVSRATQAAQTTSKRVFLPSSESIETFYRTEADTAINRLAASRRWAAAAATLVLASAAFLWWGGEPASKPTVIEVQGGAFCKGATGPTTPAKGVKYVIRCSP